jgi:hypothetical protein
VTRRGVQRDLSRESGALIARAEEISRFRRSTREGKSLTLPDRFG